MAMAVARPIPLAAPVISPFLSFRSRIFRLEVAFLIYSKFSDNLFLDYRLSGCVTIQEHVIPHPDASG